MLFRSTLKDIFAGIALQVDTPFQEGDWIDLGFAQGVVQSLRLMSTRLNTIDGAQIAVPNSRVVSEGMRRFRPSEPVGHSFEMALEYSFPVAQAIQLLEGVLAANPLVLERPSPRAWAVRYSDVGVVYRLQYWQARIGAVAEHELRSSLMEQLWYALSRTGRRIPYPGIDLHRPTASGDAGFARASADDKVAWLRECSLLNHLAPLQLLELARSARLLGYGSSEYVFREGESGDTLYIVLRGRLAVELNDARGGSLQVHTLEPTDVFGEMAVFTGDLRSATVQCLEEVWLLAVQRNDLLPALHQDPQLLDRFGQLIAMRKQELVRLTEQAAETDAQHHLLTRKVKQLFSGLLASFQPSSPSS